jgi:hypothetical protein
MSAEEPDATEMIAALAALARDVEAQRRRLDALGDLRDRVSELGLTVHDLEGLRPRLDDLGYVRDRVSELGLIVGDLSERAAAAAPPPSRAVTWLGWRNQHKNRADPAATENLLKDLASWLNLIFLRYADATDVLPECWLWHPDAVEELLCLWQAWGSAYAATSTAGASDWHDRLRPGVVRRLRTSLSTCSFDTHAAGGPTPATSRDDGITLVARWWAAGSAEPPSPPTRTGSVR